MKKGGKGVTFDDIMKRLLVTGAAGFVGARFVEMCRARGPIDIISVDAAGHFKERPEHAAIDFGTIVDRDALFDWLRSEKPDLSGVVHLGAITDTTEMDVALLQKRNVEYSQKLWNYSSQSTVPLVYASSAATYGAGELGYDDDDALIPKLKALNPYGESKRIFDEWALGEEKRGNAPPKWSGWKFFNVYGFGEAHKGRMASVILHAYNQLKSKGEIKLFKSHRAGIADGHQARDFVDVKDVIDVLQFALDKPVERGIRNLGTGKARTFLDLARAVCKAAGHDEAISFIDTPPSIRDQYQYFTEARMERLRALGYDKPFRSLEDGVTDYVERLTA
jgi:ADP-L-glycero-D-manno-heptose 6-epimerase